MQKLVEQERAFVAGVEAECRNLKQEHVKLDREIEKAELEKDRVNEDLKMCQEQVHTLQEKYMSAEELLHRTEHDHVEAERVWQLKQVQQREKMVQTAQIFMKRWIMRAQFALWKGNTAEARQERQEAAMAALEEQVRTSETRQRLLEEKYATVEAELQHTEHELEAKERKWGSKQEEQHEALVKRSQVVWPQCVCSSMCCVSVRVCHA